MDSFASIVVDGSTYTRPKDSYFCAIGINGQSHWQFKTGCLDLSSPVVWLDCRMFVGYWGGKVYATDEAEQAEIALSTEPFLFAAVTLGESASETVKIENRGCRP